MRPSKDKLYDALGELIYAVAKADGLVQPEETEKLRELLMAHPWAREIQWSFDYEHRKEISMEEAFQKALDTCKAFGPSKEYVFLFEVLLAVAKASKGADVNEVAIIERFRKQLKDHFLTLDFDAFD